MARSMPDGVDHDVLLEDHVAISDGPVVEVGRLYRPRRGTPEARELLTFLSRPGRPPAEYHQEWLSRFRELHSELCANHAAYHIDGDRPPTRLGTAQLIAIEDFARHPERWKYDPRTNLKAAERRVWDAVNGLSKR
jgi:hypothetical protein